MTLTNHAPNACARQCVSDGACSLCQMSDCIEGVLECNSGVIVYGNLKKPMNFLDAASPGALDPKRSIVSLVQRISLVSTYGCERAFRSGEERRNVISKSLTWRCQTTIWKLISLLDTAVRSESPCGLDSKRELLQGTDTVHPRAGVRY